MARFTGADGPSEQPATPSRRGWKVGAVAAMTAGSLIGYAAVDVPPTPSVSLDTALLASTGELGGVAIDPEGLVTGLLGKEVGKQLWDGFYLGFVSIPGLKTQVGDTTAIAILPGTAIAFAAKGESATALSVGGVAVATTDIDLASYIDSTVIRAVLEALKVDTTINIGQVSCFGLLAFADSSTEGTCLNVLGTFDADYRKDAGEVSFALTNPVALLGLLTGEKSLLDPVKDLLNGQPLSRILTDDFSRLTLGGPELVKLTSDYGLQNISALGGAVAIGWLGGNLVLFPVVEDGLLKGNVNYLGLPTLAFDGFPKLDGISSLLPSISVGAFSTPFPGVEVPGWSSSDLLGGATATSAATGAAPQARTLSVVNEAPADLPEIEVNDAAPLPEIEYNTGNDDAAETADGADDDVPVLDSTAQTGDEDGDQDGGADTELATDIGGTGSSGTDTGSGAQGGSEGDAGQAADTGTGTGTGSTAGTTADDSSAELVGAAG
ncbi:hypothetical protein [Gordonia sp. VNK21]|uniref:hypothetical protein n=1 Tax=Gordonia sp. VNK21 TaxID=3382483 RepID=UPI0038D38FBE